MLSASRCELFAFLTADRPPVKVPWALDALATPRDLLFGMVSSLASPVFARGGTGDSTKF